ncbi:SIR2-domain-containing protein [Lindgomyces ingoldianus]|uniref:SIR2-domain-containing protein n=1 Tax=Lindgomyces ingoldianus TaxID=673940 RepID=A0ACB6QZ89_9PLEO|nr:SIR2-domain-containing protein [Lindgomyces ingoldianus]KAF2472231.1 SIR2-domain-containing protein [Lindgomyces ingoldianus]
MASAGSSSGPVMVQEMVPAPIIDLTAEPLGEGAYDATRTSNASAPKKEAEEEEWESVSLYEEILDEVEAFEYSADGGDVCTVDEARTYKNRLHEVGTSQFILETITTGKVTARKLCTAFGVRIPKFLENLHDEAYYQLLGLAINRELNKRRRLERYNTIDDAARLLQERKNIMVITGAGISTSLGIPDFRSKNTGFYSRLQEMGYSEPEQVFDIGNFDEDPKTFYTLAGDILPDLKKWTPTHEFIRLLQDKGKLLTNYTQNIDNVESHAGIRAEKLIQCHGSWATATCRKCKYRIPGEDIFDDIRAHKPAECARCVQEIATHKPGMKRKRSSNGHKKRRGPGDDDSDSDGAYDIPQPGIMKPDITFFGEALPANFFDRLKTQDKDKVDLVIVMGTSMKVAPVSEIPNFLPRDVPQIYISRDPIHHINFDINLLGDCDAVVAELARRAGWDLTHKMLPAGQVAVVEAVEDLEATYSVKVGGSALKTEAKPEPTESKV